MGIEESGLAALRTRTTASRGGPVRIGPITPLPTSFSRWLLDLDIAQVEGFSGLDGEVLAGVSTRFIAQHNAIPCARNQSREDDPAPGVGLGAFA